MAKITALTGIHATKLCRALQGTSVFIGLCEMVSLLGHEWVVHIPAQAGFQDTRADTASMRC